MCILTRLRLSGCALRGEMLNRFLGIHGLFGLYVFLMGLMNPLGLLVALGGQACLQLTATLYQPFHGTRPVIVCLLAVAIHLATKHPERLELAINLTNIKAGFHLQGESTGVHLYNQSGDNLYP